MYHQTLNEPLRGPNILRMANVGYTIAFGASNGVTSA